ncbi:MAG: DmsE family decaheme c-type cytochrome, partial [Acidobacteriota bacterium]
NAVLEDTVTIGRGRGSGFRSMGPTAWLVFSVLVWGVTFVRAGATTPTPNAQATAKKAAEAQKTPQLPAPPAAGVGATYVGEETCATCHEDKKAGYTNSLHGKAADPKSPAALKACETCHGPGSLHAADPEKSKTTRKFTGLKADESNAVCTTCHTSGEHALWAGSKHEARGVACTACHSVHNAKGEKQLKAESQAKVCATCHQQIVNKLNRFDHMPVRENKMQCSSCHNTHGSANVKMLKAGTTVDGACTSCHAEKRGPFLWEHAPVVNACVTCHDPHGSSNDRMLVSKVPFICQRCHVTSRHPPTVYEGFLIKNSSNANKITGRGCLICHSQIHGSNSPNGKAFLR